MCYLWSEPVCALDLRPLQRRRFQMRIGKCAICYFKLTAPLACDSRQHRMQLSHCKSFLPRLLEWHSSAASRSCVAPRYANSLCCLQAGAQSAATPIYVGIFCFLSTKSIWCDSIASGSM
jgi:hypothetical protein